MVLEHAQSEGGLERTAASIPVLRAAVLSGCVGLGGECGLELYMSHCMAVARADSASCMSAAALVAAAATSMFRPRGECRCTVRVLSVSARQADATRATLMSANRKSWPEQ